MTPLVRASALAGGVFACGVVVGYAAHRCPVAVHEKVDTASTETTAKATQTRQDAGPVDVDRKVTRYAPTRAGPPPALGEPIPCPVVEVVEEHEHHGPVTTVEDTAEASATHTERHVDLTITPAAPPGWAVSVGVDDALGARQLRMALRRRLFGPFAVEVAAVPARGMSGIGAGIAVEF